MVLALLFGIEQNKGSSFQLQKQLFLEITICFLCSVSLGQQRHSCSSQVPLHSAHTCPSLLHTESRAHLQALPKCSWQAVTRKEPHSGPSSSQSPKPCTKQVLQSR